MKKINFLMISLLIVSVSFLMSCKKEAIIEKNLWNKGGEWNIQSIVANQVSTNPEDNFNETVYNYGTFIFREDGSGTYTITVDGDVEAGTFTYFNTEFKLTLIHNNDARVFDILEWEKGKMKISITDVFSSNGETVTYTETLNLVKRKF